MEKKTIRKMVPKQEKYFYDETIFIANDGKEFFNEAEAKRHETDLKLKTIKSKQIDNINAGYTWFMAVDEEELEFIKEHFGFYSTYDHVEKNGELEIGKWFSYQYEDGGDSWGTNIFTTLEFVKNSISELEKELG